MDEEDGTQREGKKKNPKRERSEKKKVRKGGNGEIQRTKERA